MSGNGRGGPAGPLVAFVSSTESAGPVKAPGAKPKGRGKVARVLHIVQNVLVVAVLVAAVPLLAYKEPALVGQDHAFVVLSGSMRPFMDPGDIIFVSEVAPDEVEIGDVITFHAESDLGVYFTHRVVAVVHENGTGWLTKGDANSVMDAGVVRPDDLVGRQDFVLPKWGYVSQFAGSNLGYLYLIIIPVLLLAWTRPDRRPQAAGD